jgi:enamine deaminase RidA (YjgF/YER057c/UK114 family)
MEDLDQESLMPIERLHPGPRMSQAVIHNHVVYLAGQVAANAHGKSVAEQTQDILATIDALLKEAGTDKGRVLSATVWLTDMATFADMNKVWDGWVVPGAAPARATVESAKLASSEYRVEIAVIAAQS